MKRLLFFPFFLMLTIVALFAGDSKYIDSMQKHIHVLYTSKSNADLQQAVNSIERIANAEKTKWEPFYYVSFGYILMATRESEGSKKDPYLDLAAASLEKALALKKDDSEIVTLKGFVDMIRITVDPAVRGPQYSGLVELTYQKALSIKANNPRALALLAQMQLGTARFFNQIPTEACETANKALQLFAGDHSDNPLAPQWGKEMTENMVKNCH
jgi:hypothetical protein